jgi:hypothetical protein
MSATLQTAVPEDREELSTFSETQLSAMKAIPVAIIPNKATPRMNVSVN